jgi:hypothetical protein
MKARLTMSQSTETPASPTLASAQGPAITALSMLLAEYSDLPPAYITLHPRAGVGFGLSLNNPQDAETWRTALGVAPAAVDLKFGGGIVWTQATASYRDVMLLLTGHGVPLSPDAAATSQALPSEATAEQVAA